MRYIILVVLCAINLSASAQWWRGDFKSHKRSPVIPQVKHHSIDRWATAADFSIAKIKTIALQRSAYNLEVSEKSVMKMAQHNMRFREYALASYNFSDLAQLYVLENRLSEAKWYYLQSILLSKNKNDNPHTISSLVSLAMVKADLGDLVQAQQDLAEARELAFTTGRADDVKLIDKKVKFVQSNKVWLPKSELRYAEAIDTLNKSK
jgi:hypothetical protein